MLIPGVRVADELGQSIILEYENDQPDAKVVRVKDYHGRSAGYAYEGDNLVAVTNVTGAVTRARSEASA